MRSSNELVTLWPGSEDFNVVEELLGLPRRLQDRIGRQTGNHPGRRRRVLDEDDRDAGGQHVLLESLADVRCFAARAVAMDDDQIRRVLR